MSLKATVRALLHGWGLDVVRWTPELNKPFAVLPLLIRERLARGQPFFFVQVGANDGVLDDPIRALVLEHRLPGLLIEPLPDMFEKLQVNYAGQPQLRFENTAVLENEGRITIHRVKRDAPVHEHWHGIASFSRANLITQGVPAEHIAPHEVSGAPLAKILARHGVQQIDLLQIDTEGYDFEVIKSAFGAGFRPAMINYEHCWLKPADRYACKQTLDRMGYEFVETGKDTLAVLKAA
jgi:FkbM family methyltransferase